MRDLAVDLLKGLVQRYSPSGKEEEVADFLAVTMSGLGFNVKRDKVGNVIGEYGEEGLRILLCGHMDTVSPNLPVHLNGGCLYGRGTVDAKGPLAALVMAASELIEEGFHARLVVIGVVDEEGKNRGIKKFLESGLMADYAVFGEPTNVDTITIGYKGSFLVKVFCETETGHSSAPWLYENSIEKVLEVWNLIKNIRFPEEDSESRFNSLSFCLRGIKGGEIGSIVPSSCEALIEIRIPPSISVKKLEKAVFNRLSEYKKKSPEVNVDIQILDHTEPYMSDRKSPLVKAFSRSIWKTRGMKVGLINKTGTGDMNIYGRSTGAPTITYGPGNSHLDHTRDEHILIQDYLDSIVVIKEGLKELLNIARIQVH